MNQRDEERAPNVSGPGVTVYRLALRLLPRDVHQRDGEEMANTFGELYRDASGVGPRLVFTLRCLLSLLGVAIADHLETGSRTRTRTNRKNTMRNWTHDFRFAARTLLRSPKFTLGAVLLLALGVGAVTSIFTLVDNILLRPLPYPEADRLVLIEEGSHSGPFFKGLEGITSVDRWAGALRDEANLTEQGAPLMMEVTAVSKGYFSLFGAKAARGRLLEPDDFDRGAVAVLSFATWVNLFGADDEIIGDTIRLDGKPVTVIGVAERSFSPPEALGASSSDLWRPLDWTRKELNEHGYWMLEVAGRMVPGATVADVSAEIEGLVASLEPEAPEQYRDRDGHLRTLPITPLKDATVHGVQVGLRLLLGAVALLLVIACSNVAHLFLARGLSRGPEMAVRRALGASTAALIRQLLIESLVVAAAGGVLGLLLAVGAVRALMVLMPTALPRGESVALDLRIVFFAVVLSASTALFFGLVPALRSVRGNASANLSARRGSTARHGVGSLRGGLVIAEVALSMMLVAGAGVLIRSFFEVNQQDSGIIADNVWVIPLNPTGLDDGEEYRRTMDPIREALAALPGVQSATYGLGLPFSFTGGGRCCWRSGFTDPEAEDPTARFPLFVHPVARDYFSTLGIQLREGRIWQPHQANSQPYPAILPESTAAELFGSSSSAVGKLLNMGEQRQTLVVGIIADVRHFGLDQEILAEIYVPMELVPFGEPLAGVAVRFASATPIGVETMLREAVWSVAPDLPVPTVVSMNQQIANSTSSRRFDSILFSTFGLVALLLAAGGLYGTLLYSVSQRRREMGIRLAVGARHGQVELQVLLGGLWVSLAGIALGLAGAWTTTRWLESRIWGITPHDPTALFAAAGLLLVTAILASWLPARRASSIDPAETLRAE